MNIVPLHGDSVPAVAVGPPRHWFSQPYGMRETLHWVADNLWGPSHRYAGLTRPLPQRTRLAKIEPRLRLAFVGDILPLRGRCVEIAAGLRAVLRGADLLIANFEGTIVESRPRRVFMGQAHSPSIVEVLAGLFPPARTLLNVANNHAGDFGWQVFERSCELLADAGFHLFGRRDLPGIVADGVALAGCSEWSNQPCDYVCRQEPAAPDALFCILCPHWGYELQAYPHPDQIARARTLLGRWDAIAGHHSHWPQPVTVHRTGSRAGLVAYSLGNFTFGFSFRRHLRGLLLTMEVGPRADGTWGMGRVRWWHTRIAMDRRGWVTLTLATTGGPSQAVAPGALGSSTPV